MEIENIQLMPGIVLVEVQTVEEEVTDSGIVIPGVWQGGGYRLQGARHVGRVVNRSDKNCKYKDDKEKIREINAKDCVNVGDTVCWKMHTQRATYEIDDKIYFAVHAKNLLATIHE